MLKSFECVELHEGERERLDDADDADDADDDDDEAVEAEDGDADRR